MLWGSKGALQYQVHTPTAWHRFPAGSRFYTATNDSGELVGFYALARQAWGYLRLLLAVEPCVLNTGVGRQLVEHVQALGLEVAGTIEEDNVRSLQLSLSVGYELIAEFENISFTRQQPRVQEGVRQPSENELEQIALTLQAQEHDWFDPDQLRPDELWTTQALSSGIQLCTHRWSLEHLGLPFADGWVRKLLPALGVDPSNFVFATGHYPWGTPEELNRLLEHALATLGLQAIVLTGDRTSKSWNAFKRGLSLGIIGSSMGTNKMLVTSNKEFRRPLVFTPLNAV